MENYEETKQKFELLKMARAQANEEYSNRRDEAYKHWLSECDTVWKETGVKLPYPVFQPYPTEIDIVAKALTLYNFIKPEEKVVPEVVEIVPEPEAKPELTQPSAVLNDFKSNRSTLIKNIFSTSSTPKITG